MATQIVDTLEQARQYPNAMLVMEADSGGQALFGCPVSRVSADQQTLNQLLVDLEMITWGRGFDPEFLGPPCDAKMYFTARSGSSGTTSATATEAIPPKIWFDRELESDLLLRELIEDVLSGRSKRLAVPPGFPYAPLASLAEAKRYPRARVVLRSGLRGWKLINCPAERVKITDGQLAELLARLDARLRTPIGWGNKQPPEGAARVEYFIRTKSTSMLRDPSQIVLYPEIVVGEWGTEIEAALNGEREFPLP